MLVWLLNWSNSFKKLKNKFKIPLIFLLVLIIGSYSFYFFEKGMGQVENFFDAVYWLLVTVTTVGYGDIAPRTTGGRITFALVALVGIGTIAYIIEEFVSFSTKVELKKLLGIGGVKMKLHTIIVGWNTTTEKAIKELLKEKEEFIVVGNDLDQTEMEAGEIPHISGDATRSETLNRCSVKVAKTMLISLTNDSQTIMVALAARKLNPDLKIIAMCEVDEHREMMIEAGINRVVSHAEISGSLLAHAVLEPIVGKFIMGAATSAEDFGIKQIKIDKKTTLSDFALKETGKFLAIYREGRFIFDFISETSLEENDFLLIIETNKK